MAMSYWQTVIAIEYTIQKSGCDNNTQRFISLKKQRITSGSMYADNIALYKIYTNQMVSNVSDKHNSTPSSPFNRYLPDFLPLQTISVII